MQGMDDIGMIPDLHYLCMTNMVKLKDLMSLMQVCLSGMH